MVGKEACRAREGGAEMKSGRRVENVGEWDVDRGRADEFEGVSWWDVVICERWD